MESRLAASCRKVDPSSTDAAIQSAKAADVVEGETAKPIELPDAPPDVQVVQSSRAWEDFGIEMSPYFCFVDGATGEVRSEGAAMTWEQVASLLRDALLDEELAART